MSFRYNYAIYDSPLHAPRYDTALSKGERYEYANRVSQHFALAIEKMMAADAAAGSPTKSGYSRAMKYALDYYDFMKGKTRRIVGDSAAIKKIKQLAVEDRADPYKLYMCFAEHRPSLNSRATRRVRWTLLRTLTNNNTGLLNYVLMFAHGRGLLNEKNFNSIVNHPHFNELYNLIKQSGLSMEKQHILRAIQHTPARSGFFAGAPARVGRETSLASSQVGDRCDESTVPEADIEYKLMPN